MDNEKAKQLANRVAVEKIREYLSTDALREATDRELLAILSRIQFLSNQRKYEVLLIVDTSEDAGIPIWMELEIAKVPELKQYSFNITSIPRHHPELIRIFKEGIARGERKYGLELVEITSPIYTIHPEMAGECIYHLGNLNMNVLNGA